MFRLSRRHGHGAKKVKSRRGRAPEKTKAAPVRFEAPAGAKRPAEASRAGRPIVQTPPKKDAPRRSPTVKEMANKVNTAKKKK